jgi:UDP-N-acetylglucosamine--N-acetylmuramyl-(pentapeptide) pyrophosphoryl-undecaprenol N-acetylglucosamine transferase
VAEIAAAGKPAIFIPLPTATDDHQRQNAETLSTAGAARLLAQSELTADRLAAHVSALLSDRAELARMAESARSFAHPDAAAKIAALAARVAGLPDQPARA